MTACLICYQSPSWEHRRHRTALTLHSETPSQVPSGDQGTPAHLWSGPQIKLVHDDPSLGLEGGSITADVALCSTSPPPFCPSPRFRGGGHWLLLKASTSVSRGGLPAPSGAMLLQRGGGGGHSWGHWGPCFIVGTQSSQSVGSPSPPRLPSTPSPTSDKRTLVVELRGGGG